MYKHNDLVGMSFGRLTVIEEHGRTSDRHIMWRCECKCGKIVCVSGRGLVSGSTRSCGCLQKDTIRNARLKHGDSDTRLYRVWKEMKRRCENRSSKSYKWYGEKGVSICEEWHDYATFRKWALENGYDHTAKYGECTIDRVNPYGNYEPSNCRWISMTEQMKNKRQSVEREESDNECTDQRL